MRHRRQGGGAQGGNDGESGADVRRSANGTPGSGRRRPEPLVTTGRDGGRRRGSRASEERRSRVARHPVVLAGNLVISVVAVALVAAVVLLVVGQRAYTAPGPLAEDVGVIIDRGASVEAIAAGLEERGIISNRFVFMAAAYGTGATRRMQAGEYLVPARATMEEVLDRIVSGRVVQHAVTVPEGLTSAQVVDLLNASEILSGRIDSIPPEGTLLPETYQVTRGTARPRVVERMRAAHESVVAQVWAERDPDLPLSSPRELVTLASIVEKETGRAAERERVAAVFVNRMKQRMRLQSDPTILYGLYGGAAWTEPRTIYKSDLDRPNPYNTYQIPALPPGPIANPGRAALEATARPADTDELYFVADGTGGHVFASTYPEHQANVERWRAIERERAGAADAAPRTE